MGICWRDLSWLFSTLSLTPRLRHWGIYIDKLDTNQRESLSSTILHLVKYLDQVDAIRGLRGHGDRLLREATVRLDVGHCRTLLLFFNFFTCFSFVDFFFRLGVGLEAG